MEVFLRPPMQLIGLVFIIASAVEVQEDSCLPGTEGSSCILVEGTNKVVSNSLLQATWWWSNQNATLQSRAPHMLTKDLLENSTRKFVSIDDDLLEVTHSSAGNSTAQAQLVEETPINEEILELNRSFAANSTAQALLGDAKEAPVCGVLWFYHLGKCGGTSIYSWMLQQKRLGGFQEVFNLWGPGPVDFPAFRDKTLQPLINNMKGKLVAVHHHHNGPGLYAMAPYFTKIKDELASQGCSLVRLTLLRDPEARLVSNLNFDMQLAHGSDGAQIGVGEHNQYFRSQLSTPGRNEFYNRYDNYQVRYLLNNFGNADGTTKFPMPFGATANGALAAANQILDSFEVVGLVEELDKSINKVSQLLALTNSNIPHNNERHKEFQKHDKLPLPGDVQALVVERTSLEQQMYSRQQEFLVSLR